MIDFRRVFLIAGVLSLTISYPLLWLRMITTPIEYTGADFIAFYAAGRIARNEGPAYLYDLDLQRAYEEQVVGFEIPPEHISPYLHPPFVAPLAQLIAGDSFVFSFILWNLVMLAFLVVGSIPLLQLLKAHYDRRQRLFLFICFLLFYPSFVSLVNGQDSALLYLGGTLWLLGMLTGRDWLAGLGLAVVTVRPHIALPLALPFLFKRRRVWWWFLLGGFLLAGLSLLYTGPGGIEGFVQVLLVSGRGVNYHTGEENMVNLIGLLLRLFPGIPPEHLRWTGWGVYCASIAGLCLVWARSKQLEEKHIGLAVILALFTAPHFHFHDFVLLVVPGVCLMLAALRCRYLAGPQAVLVPLTVSILLLFSYFAEFLKESICYLVMLAILLMLWVPERIFRQRLSSPEGVS